MPYTSTENVALFLNADIDSLSDMEQAQIDMLISYVDGVIDSYCGYSLGAKDYTAVRYNGSGTSSIDLGVFPVNRVTLVQEIGSDGSPINWTESVEALPDGTLQFLASSGGIFTQGTGNFYISFNAGLAKIPTPITFAATYLVAIHFNKVTYDLIGIKSQGATSGDTDYVPDEIPILVKRVLDRYRKLSIL